MGDNKRHMTKTMCVLSPRNSVITTLYSHVPPLGSRGLLEWHDNWVSYLDTMLQTQILSASGGGGGAGRALRLPTRIKALRVDPALHQERLLALDDDTSGNWIKQNKLYV